MRYSRSSLRVGRRGSLEGLRAGNSTPIAMNGAGYLNPNQRKTHTLKNLPKPNTLRHMNTPNKIGDRITDYSKYSKICSPDYKLRNLF